jgi:hypothetical protein
MHFDSPGNFQMSSFVGFKQVGYGRGEGRELLHLGSEWDVDPYS